MRFRKLRIAWSVVGGIVSLLLVVLWVRSYWWSEYMDVPPLNSKRLLTLASFRGTLGIRNSEKASTRADFPWKLVRRRSHPEMAKHSKPPIFGFYYEITTSSWTVEFPYWMAVLGTGSVAAAPWFRYRFSLRTLLIATALVAVLLGAVVWSVR